MIFMFGLRTFLRALFLDDPRVRQAYLGPLAVSR